MKPGATIQDRLERALCRISNQGREVGDLLYKCCQAPVGETWVELYLPSSPTVPFPAGTETAGSRSDGCGRSRSRPGAGSSQYLLLVHQM